MSCAWYEGQLANESAELWRNGRPSPALLEHARQCAACDRTIERELKLKLMFTELAEQSGAAEPSASVQHNLRTQLNALRPEKAVRFGWIPRFAIAAAAVACLVLVLLLARRPQGNGTQENAARTAVQQPAASAQTPNVQQATPVAAQTVATAKKTPKVVKRSAPHEATRQVAETANDFYPVVMCDSITCAGPAVTVRVELPASQFSARRSNGRPVMADLLVGEDGLVRGVRLLQ